MGAEQRRTHVSICGITRKARPHLALTWPAGPQARTDGLHQRRPGPGRGGAAPANKTSDNSDQAAIPAGAVRLLVSRDQGAQGCPVIVSFAADYPNRTRGHRGRARQQVLWRARPAAVYCSGSHDHVLRCAALRARIPSRRKERSLPIRSPRLQGPPNGEKPIFAQTCPHRIRQRLPPEAMRHCHVHSRHLRGRRASGAGRP